jgi:hypothetical protein
VLGHRVPPCSRRTDPGAIRGNRAHHGECAVGRLVKAAVAGPAREVYRAVVTVDELKPMGDQPQFSRCGGLT